MMPHRQKITQSVRTGQLGQQFFKKNKTVKNIAAGRLPHNNSPKMPQGNRASSPEFQRLIASFQRIAAINDSIERRFELNRSAPDHDLPRAEFRRLFELWAIATVRGGAK